MKNSNSTAKKVVRNTASSLFAQFLAIALGLILPRLYIVSFGSEMSGVLNTLTQIVSYLTLLEAGVGLATKQALYHPIISDDKEKISAILSATNIQYKKSGMIYALIIVLVAVVYPFTVHSEIPRWIIAVLVLINGVPSVCKYMVQAKYNLLLSAEGKQYISTNLQMVLNTSVSLSRIVLIMLTNQVIIVQSVYIVSSLISNIYISHYIHKNYPWLDLKALPDFAAISQRGSVMVHEISGMIFRNTDIVLLSYFCGFKTASVYTIYNVFYSKIQQLITSASSGITFAFGQLYHKDFEHYKRVFRIYETIYIMIIFIIYTMMAVYSLPIVQIYTSGVSDTNYVQPAVAWLFVAVNLLQNSKLPVNDVLNITGVFMQTRHQALIEMTINLTVSIAAIIHFGMPGCLMGTVAALLYRSTAMIVFAHKNILHESMWLTYRHWVINGLITAFVIWRLGAQPWDNPRFIPLMIHAFCNGIWITCAFVGVNFLTQRNDFYETWKYIRWKLKHRNKA